MAELLKENIELERHQQRERRDGPHSLPTTQATGSPELAPLLQSVCGGGELRVPVAMDLWAYQALIGKHRQWGWLLASGSS